MAWAAARWTPPRPFRRGDGLSVGRNGVGGSAMDAAAAISTGGRAVRGAKWRGRQRDGRRRGHFDGGTGCPWGEMAWAAARWTPPRPFRRGNGLSVGRNGVGGSAMDAAAAISTGERAVRGAKWRGRQ